MSLKILITGGSGMVGRNLLEHKRLSQHELFAPSSHELNLLDPAQTHDYVADLVPDLVIHAAGRVVGARLQLEHHFDRGHGGGRLVRRLRRQLRARKAAQVQPGRAHRDRGLDGRAHDHGVIALGRFVRVVMTW